MKIAQIVLSIVAVIAVVDILGFLAWAFSGQLPADSFYIGAITRNVLQAIFF